MGRRLKVIRKNYGFYHKHIEKKAGYSPYELGMIEHGVYPDMEEAVNDMCDYYEVSYFDLTTMDNKEFREHLNKIFQWK